MPRDMTPRDLKSWRIHMGGGKAISVRKASRLLGCAPQTFARWEDETLPDRPPTSVDLACAALSMGLPAWSKRTL